MPGQEHGGEAGGVGHEDPGRSSPGRSEVGSALPLLVFTVLACGLLAMALGRIGSAAADRARAVTAADAAALAGVAGGETEARRLARANGGELIRFEERGDDRRVTVRVGRATAVARAHPEGSSARDRGNGPLGQQPAPAMRAALSRAGQLIGRPVVVRTVVDNGLAVDVATADVEELVAVGTRAGLCRPDPEARPKRFTLCRWAPPPGHSNFPA